MTQAEVVTFIAHYLPWALSVITLVQSYLLGNKSINGWRVGFLGQAGWTAWVVASGTWGFLPLNIALWVLYARNYYKWKNHEDDASKLKQMIAEVELMEKFNNNMNRHLMAERRANENLRMELRNLKTKEHDRIRKQQAGYMNDRATQGFQQNPRTGEWVSPTPIPTGPAPSVTVFPDSFAIQQATDQQAAPQQFQPGGSLLGFAGGGATGAWENEGGSYRSQDFACAGTREGDGMVGIPNTVDDALRGDWSSPTPAPSTSSESCSASDYGSSSSSSGNSSNAPAGGSDGSY